MLRNRGRKVKLMNENKNIKACIFDLDGTLLDSMSLWQEVDRKYLARYGIHFDPKYSEEIKKMSFNESAKYFIDKFHIPRSEEEIKQDWNEMVEVEYRHHIQSKKGSYEMLEAMHFHQIKMCVATSCNKEHAKLALERLQLLPYISFILTCSEVGKNKEYPDIFHACAKKMNVKPEECFVVEDLYMALKVSKEEGFKTIGIYDHLSAHEKEAAQSVCDYYIHDFYELL
ncbi:MAG: HAD family phosphatase [Erysipelotrichia bacterium]|nr:HAD family phosphatase [Erysipelotrichia bacterium]